MNSYTKTMWVNGQAPAISAENLNHIEEGIKAATDAIIAMDAKDNGKMNVKYVIDGSVDSADQYNTVYVHIISSGFRGLVLFAGYDNYAASGNTPVTQYRFSKNKGFEYRSGIALGGHKYSWDKAWNEDWNAVGNGSGVRIITPEESAGWDDEIPLTFAGELYDIAGWDDKLWVLNQIAATPEGGTNYFWEPLISAYDLDTALEAKMNLAPVNPTAEEINVMSAGQLYGDTVNHKGIIKGGQSFYDTTYIDSMIGDIETLLSQV